MQVDEVLRRVDGWLRDATTSLHSFQQLFQAFQGRSFSSNIDNATSALPPVVCRIVAQVLEPMLRLLKSDLLHDRAYATLHTMTTLIDPDLREISRFLFSFYIYILVKVYTRHL